jgi:nitrate reductase cytochrome c-type subunit
MNANSSFDPVAQAVRASQSLGKFIAMRRIYCWTCKTDKPVTGGHFTPRFGVRAAVRRFTCCDCTVAKAEARQ